MNPKDARHTKPVLAFILIAGSVAMETYLLFDDFLSGIRNFSPTILIEIVALALTAALAFYAAFSKGLDNNFKLSLVGIIFIIYVLWSVFNFESFAGMFASKFQGYYSKYYGMATQAGKLALIGLGIIAAIPTIPRLSTEDYIRGTEEMIKKRSEMEIKAAEEGARIDAERTIIHLKASLGEEGFERFIADLAAKNNAREEAADETDAENEDKC